MPEVGITSASATVASIKLGLFASIFTFFEYFGIPVEPFTLLAVLMCADMITGLSKQKIVNMSGDEKHFVAITSHRWWLGIMKKIITLIGICSLAIAIKGSGFSAGLFMNFAISAFIGAEIYSIVQNWYIINTGKFLPEFDASGLVIKTIASLLKRTLEKQIENINSKKILNENDTDQAK